MSDEFGAPAPAARGGRNFGSNYVDSKGIPRDRWDRPILPHPFTGEETHWTRPSTLAKTLDDTYNLEMWKCRQVAAGIGAREDLHALAASTPNDDGHKGTLNQIVKDAMEAAKSSAGRNLGTALHTWTHRIEADASVAGTVPSAFIPDLKAYFAAMDAHGLQRDPRLAERQVATLDAPEPLSGSPDRYVLCPDGVYRVMDLKTGQDIDYSGLYIAQQLAIYAHAIAAWNVQAQVWEQLPPIDQTTGIVVHLPSGKGKCEVRPVNLTEGWADVLTACHVRARRKLSKTFIGPPIVIPQAQAYCRQCDTDTHNCPGCGVNVPHGTTACATCSGPTEDDASIEIATPVAAEQLALGYQQLPTADPDYKVGDTVAVAGMEFTKIAEFNCDHAPELRALTGECRGCAYDADTARLGELPGHGDKTDLQAASEVVREAMGSAEVAKRRFTAEDARALHESAAARHEENILEMIRKGLRTAISVSELQRIANAHTGRWTDEFQNLAAQRWQELQRT